MARSGRKALMTVYRNEGQYDASNVEYAAGEILAYSKTHRTDRMHHIDYGLGVFDAAALDAVPDGQPCDLAHLYAELLSQRQLAAYEVPGRFYEIGSVQGLPKCAISSVLRLAPGAGPATTIGTMTMNDFVRDYLTESVQILGQIDAAAVERMAEILAETRTARRAALHPRRGRQRRQRLARRQRFPQDRRHRSLRPHRQRLRADRPDQRRRLGRRVRGLAPRQPAPGRRPAAGPLRGRRQPGKERQPEPGGRRAICQAGRAPG